MTGVRTLARHRDLIRQLTWREVQQRYRGSRLGMVWSFVTPAFLLLVYTVVFSLIFKVRWPSHEEASPLAFGLILFAGLLPFSFVSECLQRGPVAIAAHPNLVKKAVFPLEILPVVQALGAAVHGIIGLVLLLAAALAVGLLQPSHVWLLPFAALPTALLGVGTAWFTAGLGVFIRDLQHAAVLIVHLAMFLTPIFYPESAVPGWLHSVIALNPLAQVVGMFRFALFGIGDWNWLMWMAVTAGAAGLAVVGLRVFRSLRPGFAERL